MSTPSDASRPSRLIWGAPAIARAIDRTPTQTYYLLSKGLLPARKIGDQWVADADRLSDPSQWPQDRA